MKRIFFVLALLEGYAALALHHKLTLQKAIDSRLAKAEARSTGGHQDYCMEMHVKNLGKDSLVVVIEAGRRFNSVDENDQDILLVKQEILALARGQDKWIQLKGYCCQAHNRSPQRHARYDVNKLADSSLVLLAEYLNDFPFESSATQNAIWAISDKESTARITAAEDSLARPLRRLVAALKGEPVPWYTVLSRTHVYPSGNMETFPLLLKGKLEYDNPKVCYTKLHVLNDAGIEVCEIVRQWTLPGRRNYELNLPVKGLARGKYTVALETEAQQILVRKEFEI